MERHTVSRMIGSPPGYVGYDDGGTLAEKIRRKPYQVVLLDEVEKAHPDVLNVLLQAMEDGRLTDGQGRTADFRHAILIMTSNLGAEALLALGEDEPVAQAREEVMDAVRRAFRPEFLNRLDDVLVFGRLGREEMARIVEIQLARVNERLAERGLALAADEAARRRLAELGWDPAFGARPLKRAIQSLVEDPIAERLLDRDDGGEGETGLLTLSVIDGRLALDGVVVEDDGRPQGFKAPDAPADRLRAGRRRLRVRRQRRGALISGTTLSRIAGEGGRCTSGDRVRACGGLPDPLTLPSPQLGARVFVCASRRRADERSVIRHPRCNFGGLRCAYPALQ